MSDEERISIEAAAWLVRRDDGLDGAGQDRYLDWLAADPRHGEWIARHQQTWGDFDQLAHWCPKHSRTPNPDLLARPLPVAVARRQALIRWAVPLGCAAAVMLVAWVSFFTGSNGSKSFLAESVASAPPSSGHRLLEDGSMVELNRDSEIVVEFTPEIRRVRLLRGEAYFTVAKDAQRPFVVRANGVDARAVGTVFNVRVAGGEVEVLVTEGRVQVDALPGGMREVASNGAELSGGEAVKLAVSATPKQALLEAGQRAVVSLSDPSDSLQVLKVSAEDMDRLRGWQTKLLDFSSTPLAEVVAEFNRHNRIKIVIADDSIRAIPVVASFRADNVEGFVRLLEISCGVNVERREGELVLRRNR